MILDLREFKEFPVCTTLTVGPGRFKPFADGVTAVGEVRLELAIQQSGDEFFCQGETTATYMVTCSRCLVEFEQSVAQSTDFVVCGVDQVTSRGRDGSDYEMYVYLQGSELLADVSEPVRQALLLSLSMKPLCREDCRGICPTCGVNLNEQTCDCKAETADPRWDGLKKLSDQRR
ncbi:MAG TPA: DUF177 domain-containing protein [Acidobacteriota bacterium]|nr:DUF177 domain-containing protein [Acidobacteriota bacterium]